MLTTFIAFAVVIGVLVFVHELGHLVAAKSVGIDCPRFSIGFGPRVVGFHWRGTEYVISLLPLGGYVRMAGMEDTSALEGGEAEAAATPPGRDFDSKPLWARILVVISGVVMNLIFAAVVIAGVTYVYGEPVNPSTRVAVVGEERLPEGAAALADVPTGAEITRVGNEPVETWNQVVEALLAAPAGPIALSFESAPPVTFELPDAEARRLALLELVQPYTAPVIGEVSPGSPAARAGLEPGDRIVSVEGTPVEAWGDFVDLVRASPEEPIAVTVDRQAGLQTLTVTPDSRSDTTAEGESIQIGWVGIAADVDVQRQPVGLARSAYRGAEITWTTTTAIVALLGDLATGEASPRTLGGPLTIGQISGQTARAGMEVLLQWMALLSVNLAVLNLLPIPVLDGGQLLFLLIEGLRGRPLSLEQRLRLSNVGFIIVVGIMVWAITNDFLRLFGI